MKKIGKAWPNEEGQENISGEFVWMVLLNTVSRIAYFISAKHVEAFAPVPAF